MNKQSSTVRKAKEAEKDEQIMATFEEKYKRIDGKALTAKQKRELLE